jgi:hypothetical protein
MARKTDYFKTFCKISKAFGTTATKNELLRPDSGECDGLHGGNGRLPVPGR